VPVELFSGNRFPLISSTPYLFTLGIHDYFWFQLIPQETLATLPSHHDLPELHLDNSWDDIFRNSSHDALEQAILPEYLKRSHWSRAMSKRLLQVTVKDRIPISTEIDHHWLLLIHCWFAEGNPEHHFLCLSFLPESDQPERQEQIPQHSVLARLTTRNGKGLLYDGLYSQEVQLGLLNHLTAKQKILGTRGAVRFTPSAPLVSLIQEWDRADSRLVAETKDNMLIHYPRKLSLKIYRSPEEGPNPGREILEHLSQRAGLDFVPEFAGDMTYTRFREEPMTLGIFRSFIQSQGEGDAWSLALGALHQFFENILSRKQELDPETCLPRTIFRIEPETLPDLLHECIGGYFLQLVQFLGQKVAALHLALAQTSDSAELCPEPFSFFYQRSEYQSLRTLIKRSIHALRKHHHSMPKEALFLVDRLLEEENAYLNLAKRITRQRIEGQKTRVHGNLKLTNILFTGSSFAILNFEGDPSRPMSQRRLKRSPVLDVAAVVGSCHFAAHKALSQYSTLQYEDIQNLQPWVNVWHRTVSGAFLNAYLDSVKGCAFLPRKRSQFRLLLTHFLLEKGFHEIYHSLDSRQERIAPLINGLQNVQKWR
jgi:maltose alpha-D-glucosyltransferase/alpha-amylase